MQNYEVYRASEHDVTYTQNFYNYDAFSLNLLKTKKPFEKDDISTEND